MSRSLAQPVQVASPAFPSVHVTCPDSGTQHVTTVITQVMQVIICHIHVRLTSATSHWLIQCHDHDNVRVSGIMH